MFNRKKIKYLNRIRELKKIIDEQEIKIIGCQAHNLRIVDELTWSSNLKIERLYSTIARLEKEIERFKNEFKMSPWWKM